MSFGIVGGKRKVGGTERGVEKGTLGESSIQFINYSLTIKLSKNNY